MPRRPRSGCGGLIFHVMNRGARKTQLFDTADDYAAFVRVLKCATGRVPMRILAYALMPNHWHLVLWPREDPHLSAFMAWSTATHVRRWRVVDDGLVLGRFRRDGVFALIDRCLVFGRHRRVVLAGLVDLHRLAVELGVGEAVGRFAEVDQGEVVLLGVLVYPRAAPDDLFELGHGAHGAI